MQFQAAPHESRLDEISDRQMDRTGQSHNGNNPPGVVELRERDR